MGFFLIGPHVRTHDPVRVISNLFLTLSLVVRVTTRVGYDDGLDRVKLKL